MLPFLSSVKLFDEIGIKDLLHNLHKCWNLNYFLGQSSTTLGSSPLSRGVRSHRISKQSDIVASQEKKRNKI